MNIYDVSERSGVSIATVSRVLNNNPHVSAKTRAKVLAVMEECGYVPNAFARGLGLNTMKTIGLLCSFNVDAYTTQAVYNLETALRERGYHCQLTFTGADSASRISTIEEMCDRRVDGIILIGSTFVEDEKCGNEHIRLAARSTPIVSLNGSLDFENVYCVLCDDYRASKDATLYLLNKGFKRVLHLCHGTTQSSLCKLEGFRDAYLEKGLPFDENLVQSAPLMSSQEKITVVRDFLCRLQREGLEFDAVFASEDELAIASIRYARLMNFVMPKEFAVIGYNNSNVCLYTDPELTSVAVRLPVLCQQCTDIMVGVLEGREMPRTTIFNAELVKRGSTP